jgi:hypothetical protein
VVAAVDRHVGGTVDVAGPEVLTLREMCEHIGACVRRTPRFEVVDEPPQDLIGDIGEMSERLAAPERPFEDGVADAIVLSP